MRKRTAWILGAVLLAMLLVLGVSCAKKQVTTEAEPAMEMTAEEAAAQQAAEDEAAAREAARLREEREARYRAEAARMSADALQRQFEEENIHFDFDKYVLTPQAMMLLDEKAIYLRDNPDVRVLVEGHADERGTNEYNLALGDRRANSAKSYLIKSGVDASRFTTISYGEEQPLCTQRNESCWAKNRRAHFGVR